MRESPSGARTGTATRDAGCRRARLTTPQTRTASRVTARYLLLNRTGLCNLAIGAAATLLNKAALIVVVRHVRAHQHETSRVSCPGSGLSWLGHHGETAPVRTRAQTFYPRSSRKGRRPHSARANRRSRSWPRSLWRLIAGLAVIASAYTFVAPADWVKPQWLWTKPAPRIATVDVVRRGPMPGSDGLRYDNMLLKLRGTQIGRSLRERKWHLVFCWRVPGTDEADWHLGTQAGPGSAIASVPMGVATAAPWDANVTATCPCDFRGLVEVAAVAVSPADYAQLAGSSTGRTMTWSPPAGCRVGNSALTQTTGTTPGEPPSPYRQVGQLNANVPVARFRSVLGAESCRRRTNGGTEYLFVTSSFCVQAITDYDDRVTMYAVTTLKDDFRPTFAYWAGNHTETITLGRTLFSQCGQPAPVQPSQIFAYIYAGSYVYFELHYLAAPGNYQTMILANNYLGHPTLAFGADLPDSFLSAFGRVQKVKRSSLANFRRTTTINTFGMFAPGYGELPRQYANGLDWLGPKGWEVGAATQSTQMEGHNDASSADE